MRKKLLIRVLFLLFSTLGLQNIAWATHLVGGDITVKRLGANSYEVTVTVFRDCNSGTLFDDPIYVGVYDKVTNAQQQIITLTTPTVSTLTLGDACYTPGLCLAKAVYKLNVSIPNNVNGYYLEYARCCRPASIVNMVSPSSDGFVGYCEIPDPAIVNSSPVFSYNPKGFLLKGTLTSDVGFTATDADGDVLVYSFSTPLSCVPNGQCDGTTNPNPGAVAGPFGTIIWGAGYTVANQVGDASMAINSSTGTVTVTAPNLGVYVIGVKVEEWRSGTKIGEIRRELMFDVLNPYSLAINSNPSSPVCLGNTTTLATTGLPGGYSYSWSPGGQTTTSITVNPTSTGTYNYSVTATNGGCVYNATKSLVVNMIPAASGTITGTGAVNQGQNGVAYSVGAISGATTYTWSYNGTGFSIASGAGTNSITANFSGSATSGNLTVYGVSSCGNGTMSANYPVLVTGSCTSPIVSASSNVTICNGSSASINATGSSTTGPYTYSWSPSASLSSPTISNPVASPTSSTTYTCTVTDATSCTNTATLSVSVVPLTTAPTNNAATGVGCTSFNANWSSVSGATGYKLDVSTVNTFASFVAGYNDLSVGNVVTYSVTGLSIGTNYYFRVRGLNSCSQPSSNAAYQSVTTLNIPSTAGLTSPSNGATAQCPNITTSLNWTAASGSPTGYKLYFGTDAGATNIVNGTNLGNVLTYNPLPLTANTTYYWKIVPTNTCGDASGAVIWSFSTGNTCYCIPPTSVYACTYMYITNVNVGAINNTTGCSASSYTDYSGSQSTSITQGSAAPISLTSYVYVMNYSIWIDYNNNGLFTDGGENVLTITGASLTEISTLNISGSAPLGNHKMRIMAEYTGYSLANPCAQLTYGETEDYTINVLPACTPPTTQASAFTASPIGSNSMTIGWTRGNGDNVLVIAKANSASLDPISGTTYTANATYTSGTAVGGGYCVYNGSGTSVTVTGLSASTTYYFAVYEFANAGTCYNLTQLTGNATTTCSAAPGTPTASAGTSVVSTSFTANWSSVFSTANYFLDVCTDAGFTSFVSGYNNLNVGNVISYSVTGLSAATTYYYRVRASNACGTSGNSGSITVTTPCVPPTVQASSFTASSVGSTSMTIGWTRGNGNNVMVIAKAGSAPTDPTSGTSYSANAAYASGAAVGGGYCVYDGTGTSVAVTALTASTTYYYAIYEYNTANTCYHLTQLTGNATTTCSVAPPAPTSSAGTSVTTTSFVANWASSLNATDYSLDVCTDAGFTSFVSGYNNLNVGNVITYTVTALSPSSTYYYRVRANNACGASANSGSITVTTPCAPPTVQATSFSASSLGATTMNIGWTRGNGNNIMVIAKAGSAPTDPSSGTSYTANAAYGSGTAVGGGYCVYNGTGTSVSLTALTASTTYYFALYEYASAGTCYNLTELTGSGTTTCSVAPVAPTSSAGSMLTPISFIAAWSFSANATNYLLDVCTDAGFTTFVAGYNNLNVGNVLSYNVTGLTGGTTYYYRVRANNACGASANSGSITVTTPCSNTVFADNFDGGNTWTSLGSFAVGVPSGSNVCLAPRSAANVLGTVLSGIYFSSSTEAGNYSYSTTFNCASYTGTYLNYYSYSQFESGYDYGRVYVSVNNGASYSLVETLNSIEAGWTLHSINISGLADGQAQVKLKFTLSSDGSVEYTGWNIDDISVYGCCSAPTVQASSLSVNPSCTQANVSWSNGNGSKRIVKCNTVNSFTAPVNGTDPAANSVYSSGEQVVYNGSGSSAVVTGLTLNSTYYFKVFEASCSGSTIKYSVASGANNPLSGTTLTIPAAAGTISGPVLPCPATNQTYSISVVAGASSYTWTVPTGWTITSGASTATITTTTGSAGQNGNITVAAVNACGASATQTTSVSVDNGTPAVPGAISGVAVQCPSVNAQIYSITPVANATSYTWTIPSGWSITGGQGTNSLVVTTGTTGQNGNITVTASNTCGTSTAQTKTVTVGTGTPASPGVITGTATQCPLLPGQVYSIAAVANATVYTWTVPTGWNITSGQGTLSITVTTGATGQNGVITVTAGNACGTSGPQIMGVTLTNISAIITSSSNTKCNGGSDGSATVTAFSGTSPYSYSWTNGQKAATATGLAAGNYTVTVTDAGGCAKSATVAITQPPAWTYSLTATSPACGMSDGTETVSVSGGNLPYTYQWTNGDKAAIADSLSGGMYTVLVSDAIGCTRSIPAPLNNLGAAVISIVSVNNVSCNGGSDGAINISLTGGTAPYTFSWINGATTQNISGLTPAPYEVQVTDAGGCWSSISASVSEPAPVSVNISTTPASCGTPDGTASVVASGGTGPFSYLWNTSGTTATITGLSGGSYAVTATDSKGCTAQGQAAVNNSAGAVITLDSIVPADCNTGVGAVYVTVAGGVPPYTYAWSNGVTTQDLLGASDGTYALTVSGGNSCVGVFSGTIPPKAPYTPVICMVTVDTTTGTNECIFEKDPAINPGISHYNIYRETSASGVYKFVGLTPSNQISTWTDSIANPQQKSWRYKISAVDTCGTESPLSAFHKTIHLSANLGLGGVMNLVWDQYEGFSYSTYIVWRYNTKWDSIASIAGNPNITYNSYTDVPPSFTNLSYFIEVRHPFGCTPSIKKGPDVMTTTVKGSKSNSDNRASNPVFVNEIDNNSVIVYPNPTSGTFQISSSKFQIKRAEIYNLFGAKLYSQSANTRSFTITCDLPSGVYFLKAVGDKQTAVRKIVISR